VPSKDQRKNRRFELHLPFELIRTGSRPTRKSGQTRNMSSGGVLFTSDAEVRVGEPIEYVITLPRGSDGRAVRLRCVGKVVRYDPDRKASPEEERPPAVAATLERFVFIRSKD
jgi:PilZ domain